MVKINCSLMVIYRRSPQERQRNNFSDHSFSCDGVPVCLFSNLLFVVCYFFVCCFGGFYSKLWRVADLTLQLRDVSIKVESHDCFSMIFLCSEAWFLHQQEMRAVDCMPKACNLASFFGLGDPNSWACLLIDWCDWPLWITFSEVKVVLSSFPKVMLQVLSCRSRLQAVDTSGPGGITTALSNIVKETIELQT